MLVKLIIVWKNDISFHDISLSYSLSPLLTRTSRNETHTGTSIRESSTYYYTDIIEI